MNQLLFTFNYFTHNSNPFWEIIPLLLVLNVSHFIFTSLLLNISHIYISYIMYVQVCKWAGNHTEGLNSTEARLLLDMHIINNTQHHEETVAFFLFVLF